MSKTFVLFCFLNCILFLWMKTSLATYTITFIRHPPKCYALVSYRTVTGDQSACESACEKDRKCLSASFLFPFCKLSRKKYREHRIIRCNRKNVILEKVVTKVKPTTKATTTPTTIITTPPTTPTTMIIIEGPTPRWIKQKEKCYELRAPYKHFKVKDEAECKLRCYLDEECLVLEFRPDHFICKFSNKWHFRKVKYCNHWGVMFLKGNHLNL